MSRLRAAASSGVNRSRCGPICTKFRRVQAESHHATPSWCFAHRHDVADAAVVKKLDHRHGIVVRGRKQRKEIVELEIAAQNCGVMGADAAVDVHPRPVSVRIHRFLRWRRRGGGTECNPRLTITPSLASRNHSGAWCLSSDSHVGFHGPFPLTAVDLDDCRFGPLHLVAGEFLLQLLRRVPVAIRLEVRRPLGGMSAARRRQNGILAGQRRRLDRQQQRRHSYGGDSRHVPRYSSRVAVSSALGRLSTRI